MGSTTLQPRFGEDKYPLGRFIVNRARALGLSRSDLVRRLGYRNLSGGHRALSTALLSGVVASQIADHLATALEADETLVAAVVYARSQQKDDEARRFRFEREQVYSDSFRPHLQVQTERRVPSPIFVAALLTVARLRIIHLLTRRLQPRARPETISLKPSSSTIAAKLAGMYQPSARSQVTLWS
jgi:hypothetical protein